VHPHPRLRLGLGTAALAREGVGPQPEERAAALLRLAAEQLGGAGALAHLDTAPWLGDAEVLLGRCFEREPALRRRFQVATGWGIRSDRAQSSAADLSLASLHRSLEASAARLQGVDRFDLHVDPGEGPGHLSWLLRGGDGCLERLRDLRKRRVHGISQLGLAVASRAALALVVRSPELLEGFDLLQLDARLATEDLELAARLQSLGLVLVVSPGASGFDPRALGALPDALLLVEALDPAQLAQQVAAARSWAAGGPLEIEYACEGGAAAEAREVEAAILQQLAIGAEPTAGAEPARDPHAAADRIARVLIGSRKTRLGPAPTGRALHSLRRRIADYVSCELPVDVILTWGPRKFHAAREDNAVDVAELCALLRLAAFQAEARRIHPPGLRYTLFYEDLEGLFIEGEQDDAAFWPYGAGLVRLVNLLGDAAGVRVISTSGLLRRFDPAEVRARLAENAAHLRDCWHGAGDPVALERLGFAGGIDATSKLFYVGRLDRLLADRRTPEEKQDMVIRLFAAVLLHRQLEMFRVRPELEAVKLSFLGLAGGPPSLAEGRVDVRSISADLCRHSLAPWSAKGYLRRREGAIQPAAKPWPEPLPAGGRLLRGELRLRSGGASAWLRADRLVAGP
jgi:hypothetical protein